MRSGLVVSYLKSALAGESFTIIKKELTLEGGGEAVSPKSARPQMSSDTENKSHG